MESQKTMRKNFFRSELIKLYFKMNKNTFVYNIVIPFYAIIALNIIFSLCICYINRYIYVNIYNYVDNRTIVVISKTEVESLLCESIDGIESISIVENKQKFVYQIVLKDVDLVNNIINNLNENCDVNAIKYSSDNYDNEKRNMDIILLNKIVKFIYNFFLLLSFIIIFILLLREISFEKKTRYYLKIIGYDQFQIVILNLVIISKVTIILWIFVFIIYLYMFLKNYLIDTFCLLSIVFLSLFIIFIYVFGAFIKDKKSHNI